MSEPGPTDGAWATALQQARFWLEHLGGRDYDGQKIRDFSAWIEAAPGNEVAFREACQESLARLSKPNGA